MIFEGQRDDIDAFGDRWYTSYPNVSSAPELTSWWTNDLSEMPGAEAGINASGFEMTYDRLRVLSAMSSIMFPLYLYSPGREEDRYLGSYIGLENDGMVRAHVTLDVLDSKKSLILL